MKNCGGISRAEVLREVVTVDLGKKNDHSQKDSKETEYEEKKHSEKPNEPSSGHEDNDEHVTEVNENEKKKYKDTTEKPKKGHKGRKLDDGEKKDDSSSRIRTIITPVAAVAVICLLIGAVLGVVSYNLRKQQSYYNSAQQENRQGV